MSEREITSASAAAARSCRTASWIAAVVALLFVFHFRLVPALVAGLLVHSLLVGATRRLRGRTLSHGAARVVAALLLGTLAAAATVGIVLGLRAFLRGHVGGLPELFTRMALPARDGLFNI